MEKINNTFNAIMENNFARIITELTIMVLLFGICKPIGFLIAFILLIEIILTKEIEHILCIYLFLSFFDQILILDIIGGSISRVFMVVIFMKLLIDILKNKIKPNKFHLGLMIFFTISFIVEIITIGFSLELLFTVFNIVMFLVFSMTIKIDENKKMDIIVEKIYFTIIIAVFFSVIYGLATNNFIEEIESEDIIQRFSGTYEPNFMCMYIDLAILSLLAIKDKFNKIVFYILLIILTYAAIQTASMTGLGLLIFSIILYLIFNRKKLAGKLKYIFTIAIISIIILIGFGIVEMIALKDVVEDNEVVGIFERIHESVELLKEGEIDTITSGRLSLTKTFLDASFDRPIFNILFGNGPTTKTLYSARSMRYKYSHNTYADILYNFGIVGFITVTTFVFARTRKNNFLNTDILDNKYCNNIKLIRIMLLMYALALTLYTKRMFLIFLIL